jgi:hypothetical protein
VARGLLGLVAGFGVAMLAFASSAFAALPANCSQSQYTVTCTFEFTGAEQAFTVPRGIGSVLVDAVGAAGGGGDANVPGGVGGTAGAPVSAMPGEVLYVEIGGAGTHAGGWNGGGGVTDGAGGGGGGASDVRTISCRSGCPGISASLDSRLVVAAGGGGGGANAVPPGTSGAGGAAGSAGANAGNGGGSGGAPGTLAGAGAGGAGGIGDTGASSPNGATGVSGGLGQGGAGSGGASAGYLGYGGGGGGGYYGGGGGGSGPSAAQSVDPGHTGGGGGGGGGSYAPGGTTGQAVAGTPATVTISYGVPAASVAPGALSFATQTQGTLSASQPVTVTDTGDAPLHVTGLTFTGADAGDFLVTSDDCRGNTVDPGSSCVVNVGFAPQAQDSRTATLQIAGDDLAAPATVALTGTGGQLAAGPQGAPGSPGAQGQAGSAGPTGETGPPGSAGQTGPTGSQGQPGSPGLQGQAGPAGPTGPAGTVICKATNVALVLCSIVLQPGTWSTNRATVASYRIARHGHIIATGRVTIRHRRLTVRSRRLRPGRYVLTVTTASGRNQRVLLRWVVLIPGRR